MVAPVTGPTNSVVRWTGSEYKWSSKYKQAKPVTVPLQYSSRSSTKLTSVGSPPYNLETAATWSAIGGVKTSTWNRCYEKLKNEVSDRASLAVSLAEANQSKQMIVQRATQLWQFTKAVKRGRLGDAATILNRDIEADRRRLLSKRERYGALHPEAKTLFERERDQTRKWAGRWLEYQLGWTPLVNDIYNAVKVIQAPLKSTFVRANALDWTGVFWHSPHTEYRNPTTCPGTTFIVSGCSRSAVNSVAMGCEVSVSNPNLWLANQMGVTNPLMVIYELVPFSFVANWFVNLEQMISSITDWHGLSITNAWNSQRQTGVFNYYYSSSDCYFFSYGGATMRGYNYRQDGLLAKYTSLERKTGLVNPTFAPKPIHFPWQRALTAISLVTQVLTSGKR